MGLDFGARMSYGRIVRSFAGVLFLDSNNHVLKRFPSSNQPEAISSLLQVIEKGSIPPSIMSYLEEAASKGMDKFVVADKNLLDTLRKNLGPSGINLEHTTEFPDIEQLLLDNRVMGTVEEYRKLAHEVSSSLLASEVKEKVSRRDLMLVHAVNVMEDLDRSVNAVYTRCREWYGIHFPELAEFFDDAEPYLKIVHNVGGREKFDEDTLSNLLADKNKVARVCEAAGKSLGGEIDPKDVEMIMTLSGSGLTSMNLKREFEEYVKSVMMVESPNLAVVAGPLLGAKLLSVTGGLERLARLPSSTIQVIGAEKALFRFLKTRRGGPKHGLIFQHPYVHGSPKWQRGKIARVLASKISIAARVDFQSGQDRSDEIKRSLDRRIDEIHRKYSKPPELRPHKRHGGKIGKPL